MTNKYFDANGLWNEIALKQYVRKNTNNLIIVLKLVTRILICYCIDSNVINFESNFLWKEIIKRVKNVIKSLCVQL